MEKSNTWSFRRVVAMLLCAVMLLPMLTGPVSAAEVTDPTAETTTAAADAAATGSTEEATEPPLTTASDEELIDAQSSDVITVIAASDFQPADDSVETGKTQMTAILNMIKVDYATANGFLFCGDYDYSSFADVTQTTAGKDAIQAVMQAAYGTAMDEVYVQGNHDPDSMVGSTLSSSGAHDTESYGVYVINEKDYMWYNNDEATIKNTAAALDVYLDEKIDAQYSKPIFVVSHLALNYNMRTYNDGDGMYANYIFDVLNQAGAEGLNIIFLFGHDHSNGWDDYLGGSAVYLAKGDSINIAQGSKTKFDVETLNFTYMNAGYVGYYADVNEGTAETDLTMTVFQIADDTVTIARYSAGGKHDLKSAGVTNSYKSETAYAPDTKVYASAQTVELNQVAKDSATGVVVAAPGLTGIKVSKGSSTVPDGYSAYVTYDITATGYAEGDTASVTIPVDSSFDTTRSVIVIDHEEGTSKTYPIVDGAVTFTVTHFSQYTVAQAAVVAADASGTLAKWGNKVTALEAGKYYVITTHGEDWVLSGTAGTNKDNLSALMLEDEPVAAGDLWYYDGTKLRYGDTDQYLFLTYHAAYIEAITTDNEYRLASSIWLNNDGETFTIQRGTDDHYLNQYGGDTYDEASAYSQDGNTNTASKWYFYELVEDVQTVSLTVTPSQNAATTGETITMTPEIVIDGESVDTYTLTWSSSNEAVATVSNGIVTPVSAGQVTITATLTAAAGSELTAPISVDIPVTVYTIEKDEDSVTATTVMNLMGEVTTLTAGQASGPFVIRSKNDMMVLTGNKDVTCDPIWNGTTATGLGLQAENNFDHVWYYDGTNLRYDDPTDSIDYLTDTDNYLAYENGKITLGEYNADTAFNKVEQYNEDTHSISGTGSSIGGKYINQYGGAGFTTVSLYGTQSHSLWYFYNVTPNANVSLSVSPRKRTLHPGEDVTLTPTVLVADAAVSGYTLTWTSSNTSVATVSNGVVTAVSGGNATIIATLTAVDGEELGAPMSVEIPIQVVRVTTGDTGVTATVTLEEGRVRVTTLEESVPYVIVQKDSGYVLTGGDELVTSAAGKTGLELKDLPDDDFSHVWYYEAVDADTGYLVYGSPDSGKYLIFENDQVKLGTSPKFDKVYLNSDGVTFTVENSSITGSKFLNQFGGGTNNAAYVFSTNGSGNGGSAWYFYSIASERDLALTVSPASAGVMVGATVNLTAAVTMDNEAVSKYTIDWTSSDESIALVNKGVVTTVSGGSVKIRATLTAVDGEELETPIYVDVPITVTGVKSATISGKEGTVAQRASTGTKVGVELTVTYEDNTVETVPVTVAMLTDADGKRVSTYNAGKFENLTVTYGGFTVCNDFTLNVLEREQSDYPEYPEEGSVSVDKTGSGVDFQSSGVAQIELSAVGVPSRTGADIIIILDASSSMNYKIGTTGQTRMHVLTASLNNLMTQFQADGADGEPMDIRVAVADFNGYYFDATSPYYINAEDTTAGNAIRGSYYAVQEQFIYTGSNKLDAGAFVDVHTLGQNPFTTANYTGETSGQITLVTHPGTNYDYAFDAAYQMGSAINAENDKNDEDRDLYVIFMSDGAPYQYNYYSSDSNAENWNNWLLGTMTDEMFKEGADASYYHEDGLHWMAEAIKGGRTQYYPVIRKNDARDTDGDTWIEVEGLGATMYSIGFCLEVDQAIREDTMHAVIQNIASSDEYYFKANSAEELGNAFDAITNDIFYSASYAYFIDEMGSNYDIQLADRSYEVIVDGQKVTRTVSPKIQSKAYSVYTNQDVLEGTCDISQVGTRKTDADGNEIYTLLEEVTFNADGTEAYSNVIGSGTNVLEDGVICASTFWYNTTSKPVTITLKDGETYSLPAETFYWNLGTITTTEQALSYYVYLTGSMEGTRNAGIYDTNAHAELYYVNYLGHDCVQSVPTPKLPWQQATVGYGFYLVDVNGNPVVNQSTGETGSFENAVKLTVPVYTDMLLNADSTSVKAILASGKVPDGYTLFDSGAKYEVSINSNGSGSYTITATAPGGKQTTYVVGVQSTPVTGGDADGETTETLDYATANTVVWFGVLASVKCVPDAVVIDYGLPVDINVLANDTMLGDYGQVDYIGSVDQFTNGYNTAKEQNTDLEFWEYLQSLEVKSASEFSTTTVNGTYGVAEKLTDSNIVRYTLNTSNGMQMQEEETFVYAAKYFGTVGKTGYYYSTVTVIPATTIYYEDSFVSYSVWNVSDDSENTESTKQWAPAEDAASGNQAQDRPGEGWANSLDANNIYGYDGAYKNMTTYSMGSAMKVTVDEKTYGEAQFTFWGTGFDVVSLTSNTTGTILVDVFDADDFAKNQYAAKRVESRMVDTFYGYKQEFHKVTYTYVDGEWTIAKETDDVIIAESEMGTSQNPPVNPAEGATYTAYETRWVVDPSANTALYQVPVIKLDGLEYGRYTVVITAYYRPALDHQNKGSYDFYLDAIRVYDPANDGKDNQLIEDAYVADGEGWPEYFELRNLLISKNTFDSLGEEDSISGVVFIDNTADANKNEANSISDYTNYGPNNEVYLAPDQAIAFKLEVTDANLDSIHLALKSVGGVATAKVHNAEVNTANIPYRAVGTATDLYYDITQLNGKTVVIYNSSDSAAILSVTNIKVTYKTAHTDSLNDSYVQVNTEVAEVALLSLRPLMTEAPGVPEEIVPETTVPESTAPETTVPENTKPETTVPEVTVPEATKPETTVPEATAPEATKPETTIPETTKPEQPQPARPEETQPTQPQTEEEEFETVRPVKPVVKLSDDSVRIFGTVTVTVTTGSDAAYITINGQKVTAYTEDRNGGARTWQVRIPAESEGQLTIQVTAYSMSGVASETVTESVTVTKQPTSWLETVLKWLLRVLLGVVI